MSVNPIKLALEQALEAAFRQCGTAGMALNDVQRQILQQVTQTVLIKALTNPDAIEPGENPLDALTEDQRQTVLDFIAECDRTTQDWKTVLFNDWLQGRDSGPVQFLRDRYGFDWINRVQRQNIAAYIEDDEQALRVGDRLEVSSRLWEWIPEDLGEEPEWLPCVLVNLTPPNDLETTLNGTVQFENGVEIEIQGLNDWNKSNWRYGQP
jgi:multidrug efflux pump subunit AcrA (membrane-fusion protein)